MAKIIKFKPRKRNDTGFKVMVQAFVDYAPAENCSNDRSCAMICVKCGACGREFIDGILQRK